MNSMRIVRARATAKTTAFRRKRRSLGARRVRGKSPGINSMMNDMMLAMRSAPEEEGALSLAPCMTKSPSLGNILRHGGGDAYITLNVGGKEFHTLRSTVNSCPVLAQHVAQAEANHEVTLKGAVFIDRDPKHFDFILQYLRNKLDLTEILCAPFSKRALTASEWRRARRALVELPDDSKVLRELYTEATYFQLKDLQSVVKGAKWLANLTSAFSGGSGNPFDSASRVASQVRNALLAAGTVGGGTMFISMKEELSIVFQWLGLKGADVAAE